MYGLFQTAFYFGYMALFSMCLGIMCGTLGKDKGIEGKFGGVKYKESEKVAMQKTLGLVKRTLVTFIGLLLEILRL